VDGITQFVSLIVGLLIGAVLAFLTLVVWQSPSNPIWDARISHLTNEDWKYWDDPDWKRLVYFLIKHDPPCDQLTSRYFRGCPWPMQPAPGPMMPASRAQSTADLLGHLRRQAWQNDDFWAEVELGNRYGNASDPNYDRVEAYVWDYLATINGRVSSEHSSYQVAQDLDDTRGGLESKMSGISVLLSAEERDDVRNRITYILACRGPSGFAQLGDLYAPWTPAGNGGGGYSAVSLLEQNDHDALMFYQRAEIAAAGVSPIYAEYRSSYESYLRYNRASGAEDIIHSAENDAQRWHPPFQFYPKGYARGGIPLTDECAWTEDARSSNEDVQSLAPLAIQRALWTLHFLTFDPTHPLPPQSPAYIDAVRRFERHEHIPETGELNAAKTLRLFQLAATTGDAAGAISLAKMYVLGIFVDANAVEGEHLLEGVANNPTMPNLYRGLAFYDLAALYYAGAPGIAKDDTRAKIFDFESHKLGFNHSNPRLGELMVRQAEIEDCYRRLEGEKVR
jgi:hypothetical protein